MCCIQVRVYLAIFCVDECVSVFWCVFSMPFCLMSSTSCFSRFGVLCLFRVVVLLLRQFLLSDWFACFLKVSSRWLFGWNTTAALCCCSNKVCSNGTAGCHDYTELPSPSPLHPPSPFSLSHCFCLLLTPPTNILRFCASSAPSASRRRGQLPASSSDKAPCTCTHPMYTIGLHWTAYHVRWALLPLWSLTLKTSLVLEDKTLFRLLANQTSMFSQVLMKECPHYLQMIRFSLSCHESISFKTNFWINFWI